MHIDAKARVCAAMQRQTCAQWRKGELRTCLAAGGVRHRGVFACYCAGTAIVVGFKRQRATWIRCALYVSVLHTSYTDTNKDGTYHVVVGMSI